MTFALTGAAALAARPNEAGVTSVCGAAAFGPTTAGAAGAAAGAACTSLRPSAPAGVAKVATRPPAAATITAPLRAGWADSRAIVFSSDRGL